VIFSVGCDSRIRHHTKNRIDPIFCAVSDAAVASDTKNHVHVNTLLLELLTGWPYEFVIKSPKMWPTHFLPKLITCIVEKVAQNFRLFLLISKPSKVNNRPLGKNAQFGHPDWSMFAYLQFYLHSTKMRLAVQLIRKCFLLNFIIILKLCKSPGRMV
jgi:hypothetical protein